MAKKRIHQLASEWGVTSKDILERLEKMGIKGKKAQSSLTESESQRVYAEMGLGAAEEPRVVTRRSVERGETGTAEKVVTETRVAQGVVRRRTRRTRVAPASGSEGPAPLPVPEVQVATAVDLSPEVLASFDPDRDRYGMLAAVAAATGQAAAAEVAEPQPVETPPEPEVAGAPEEAAEAEATPVPTEATAEARPEDRKEEVPAETAPAETQEKEKEEEEEVKPPVADPEKLAAEMLSRAEEAEKRPAGPRVLGRIDLTRKPKPVLPQKPAEAVAKPGEAEQKEGRKRKRRVVRKEDMFDAFERSMRGRPRKRRAAPGQKVKKTEVTVPKASKRVVRINEVTTPGELAKAMGVKAGEVLGVLMRLGVMKSINDTVDFDTAVLAADEFGYSVENTAIDVEALLHVDAAGEEGDVALEPRPPVVTVMGHVDHGKTSLLDAIRKTKVVDSESGGITQHIGAYTVDTPQGSICFLDTPGHAAFTSMRARGASVTDIVILVVAADDGVMPQTIEAINHAKAADIPVVVAVNKIDRPDANPDRVKQQLSEHGLQPEEWGGDTQYVEVSALQRKGLDELLEAVSLLAQILELKAPVSVPAHGTVIEARLDRGRGPVATLLVQKGVLHRGDYFVVGETTGRVRAMMDPSGRQVKEARPSQAVEILGIDEVPQAGDPFDVVDDLARATQIAEHRREAARKAEVAASARMSLEDLQRQVASGEVTGLEVIIKADVQGSAEALKQALEKLSTDEVSLKVIHTGVGAINESDVQLAMASKAIVIGFHVRPDSKARVLAEREGVDIRLHTVIYEAIDEVKAALEGLLEPEFKEVIEGRAEVRQTFHVPGGGVIAGCYVTDGKVARNASCRLLRDNVVVHTGSVGSLRRFKDDVREVQSGYECGVGIAGYNDVKVGDVIECYRLEEIKRSLGTGTSAAQPSA
ncbi:MAG: translation initiation factor IF-2 [Deltaproteobacteria bacterium]|nr:MAG: translation initiation factor IF-2 [Deltaproteobacteria bacterium]